MSIKKVAVIGAGLMGGGITQACGQAGFQVINIDINEDSLIKAKATIEKLFNKKIEKQKMDEQTKKEIVDKITYSSNFELLKEVDLIIEAGPENIDIKKDIFKKIDQYMSKDTILVSNTSGLSISQLAAFTTHCHNVMGVHFFYPAPVMKLAELIRGIATSDKTYEIVREFVLAIKKEVVDCPELPGFIVNRILVPMMNEAAFLVMEGCAPKDVDMAMKLGANHPMGPLELCDFVGIDIMLATMNGLYSGFKDSKYRPCPILENMVKAGRLGKKTGQGFYTYN